VLLVVSWCFLSPAAACCAHIPLCLGAGKIKEKVRHEQQLAIAVQPQIAVKKASSRDAEEARREAGAVP